MKRRAFLVLAGVAPTVPMFEHGLTKNQANLRLLRNGEPVTEPLPVTFYWDVPMKAKLWPSETVEVDGIALYQGGELIYRGSDFDLLRAGPAMELEVEWTIRK